MNEPTCIFCGKECVLACQCGEFYCSKECQLKDRKNHKEECLSRDYYTTYNMLSLQSLDNLKILPENMMALHDYIIKHDFSLDILHPNSLFRLFNEYGYGNKTIWMKKIFSKIKILFYTYNRYENEIKHIMKVCRQLQFLLIILEIDTLDTVEINGPVLSLFELYFSTLKIKNIVIHSVFSIDDFAKYSENINVVIGTYGFFNTLSVETLKKCDSLNKNIRFFRGYYLNKNRCPEQERYDEYVITNRKILLLAAHKKNPDSILSEENIPRDIFNYLLKMIF